MFQESRAQRYTVLHGIAPYESLLEIKRSEFIGHVKRVYTTDEARAYIDSLRKSYHDARHVCSAFVLGADREIQRSSDDGEPAGTAGIPMLQALLARQTRIDEGGTDLSDLVAVVVRYFGGIKLGAGGLVRAYTDAVVQTLDNAHFDSRERMRVGTVLVSLAEVGRVENEIRASGIEVLGTEYLPTGYRPDLSRCFRPGAEEARGTGTCYSNNFWSEKYRMGRYPVGRYSLFLA